jgi:glycerol 3-phosphatase-2
VTPPAPKLPAGTDRPLHQAYDTALLDLDGVVYRGTDPVPHAVQALTAAAAQGLALAYVTNNASRTPQAVAGILAALGLPATTDQVVTSAQAAARLAAERFGSGARILVIGGEALREAVRERGLQPVDSADDQPAAVLQGYHPDIGWPQLAEAGYAVARGVPWIATNLDMTVPTPRGLAPENGALAGVVTAVTGQVPEVAGKPEPPLHRETILRTGAQRPLIVGDRLDTDIEGANRADSDSLLVLTGVTTPADLITAPPHHRPTFLAADLRGLHQLHPAVHTDGKWFRCRDWDATVHEGELELHGTGDRHDALRALCAAAWATSHPPDPSQSLALLW